MCEIYNVCSKSNKYIGSSDNLFLNKMIELKAIKNKEVLTASEDAALQLTMNRTLRGLALEDGKEKLLRKDFTGARQSFDEAKKFRHSWKLILVSLGLRVAPEMLWRLYNRRLA